MVWGTNGEPNTLTSSGTTIEVTDITSQDFNVWLSHLLDTGGTIRAAWVMNNDTLSQHAERWTQNGGTDSTTTSSNSWNPLSAVAEEWFHIGYLCDISGEEKLSINFMVRAGSAGTGSAPEVFEHVGKFTGSTITSFKGSIGGTGSADTDSNLTVFGSESTHSAAVPALGANVQDNSIFVETDTYKRYLFSAETSNLTFEDDFDTNDWTNSPTGSTWSITSGELQFTDSAGSSEIMYYDLGAGNVSDTKWVLRFRLDIDSWTQGTSASSEWVLFGLSSTTGNSASTQDSMMCTIRNNSTSESLAITRSNGTNIEGQLGATDLEVLGSTGSFYVEMIRESDSNYTINVRSGSHSGTLLGSQSYTNGSGVAGLRYLKAMNHSSSSTDADSSGGFDDIEFYNNVTSTTTPATWNLFDMDLPFLGVFGGGNDGSNSNVIDYITIATTGNATDFGDLTVARRVDAACDDSSRGLFCGVSSGTIDYITIGTTGNATDFGDMNTNGEGAGGVSSETRGCIGGGYIGGGSSTNAIDYVTIQTTGNASDFGDLTVARYGIAGGLSNNTRGCFAGGSGSTTTIDYITIATTGNATDFGDLTVGRYNMQGLSSSTRGCIGGGTATTNIIDYITIATTGNATDFGDLTIARRKAGGVSSETRGVWGGGHNGSTQTNVMDYITIDTTGNATDFGDLTVARDGSSGVSGK